MKKLIMTTLLNLIIATALMADSSISGFWKTINEKTGKAESVVAIYEHQGKHYGRIIGTFDERGFIKDSIYKPIERAPGVIGNPFYSGMDIIWDLKQQGTRFVSGSILDPERGKTYGAELWNENGKLIVRGKILFLGRNQTWLPVADSEFKEGFKKPDMKTFVPDIPKTR